MSILYTKIQMFQEVTNLHLQELWDLTLKYSTISGMLLLNHLPSVNHQFLPERLTKKMNVDF